MAQEVGSAGESGGGGGSEHRRSVGEGTGEEEREARGRGECDMDHGKPKRFEALTPPQECRGVFFGGGGWEGRRSGPCLMLDRRG